MRLSSVLIAVSFFFLLSSTNGFAQFVDVATPELAGGASATGVAWIDFDADGDEDLLVANFDAPNRLFQNDAGSLVPLTPSVFDVVGPAMSVAWADVDNDGLPDLYVAYEGAPNRLFQNLGAGMFEEVSPSAVAVPGLGVSVVWLDFDNDGLIDLYHTRDNEPNLLFRNLGGFTFAQVLGSVTADGAAGRACVSADYDLDGDLDMYLCNSGGPNHLYRNDDGVFTDATPLELIEPGPSVCADWGDFDNDGDFDLFVSNFFAPNHLYRNDGGGAFTDVTPITLGVVSSPLACMWEDVDNDGWLDLFLVNHLSENVLFRNLGGGDFGPSTDAALADAGSISIDATWSDYDADGDLDAYLANASPNRLLRNDSAAGNSWIKLRLIGSLSNRSAIGARVVVTVGGIPHTRRISGGGRYLSQDSLVVHVGLGAVSMVDQIDVYWPSGIVSQLTAQTPNQLLVLTEPSTIEPEFRRGDQNGDGTRNIADAVLALEQLFVSGTTECLDAADINDDGLFNIADPIFLLGYLFASGLTPPAPFSACGVDPTVDGLDCAQFSICP